MAGRYTGAAADPAQAVLLVRDLDGGLRGLGFVADRHGTVVTAHEVVAGLARVVLHTPGGQSRVLGAGSIDLLPGQALALLRTDTVGGLPGPALPLAHGTGAHGGGPHEGGDLGGGPVVMLQEAGERPRPGGVLGRCAAGYPWQDDFHPVAGALLIRPDRPGPVPPAGSPVLDADTGAVLAVVTPGLILRGGLGRPDLIAAAPIRPGPDTAGPDTAGTSTAGGSTAGASAAGATTAGPLAELLERNAAEVPAFGRALNLAGLLRLAAVQLGSATAGPGRIADLAADRVDRPDGICGEEPRRPVTVLLGAPGTGRTTEIAALAVRRSTGPNALPTLWLRGADLDPGDESLAAPVGRALARAAALLGVPAPGPDPAAALGTAARRPLLVVLDGPEEAPAAPTAEWLAAGTQWLAATGARLLTAARPDGWERLACWHPGADVHRLGPLPADAAARAARRYGLPPGWLDPADAVHPLAVRLAGELHAAGVAGPVPGRDELFAAHLDLLCLRAARRLAAAGPRRQGAHRRGAPPPPGEDAGRIRRLAAVMAGRVHEAARLMLGTGHGGLDAADFDRLFPVAGGWAAAVLTEGLFVPAGPGFRTAYEEQADWLQSLHLDLDEALRLLLAERAPDVPEVPPGPGGPGDDAGGPPPPGRVGPGDARSAEEDGPGERERGEDGTRAGGQGPHGVPRHRVGPVVAALGRSGGAGADGSAAAPDGRLERLWPALESAEPGSERDWWAGRLLAAVLPTVPDAGVHRVLLERLAERAGRDPRFGPEFWASLSLAPADRLALLRRLVATDGPGQTFRTVTAALLTAAPGTVIPLLCGWLDDRPADGRRADGREPGGHRPGAAEEAAAAAAAEAAHELLFAHRRLALDDLTEALVAAAHLRADALLGLLAAEEPSALCRAVDRWSHDPRPERHVAAAVHALRTAPHASGPGPRLLRHTARTLLAREDEPALHGAALALLVRDPATRSARLADALSAYLADDPFVTPEVLAPALDSHPEAVLTAFRERLARPRGAAGPALRVLAEAADPQVARQGMQLVAALLRRQPERTPLPAALAGYLDRLLELGRDVQPLLAGVITAPPGARRALALLLVAPGDPERGWLLDTVLAAERDPEVLGAVLAALVDRVGQYRPARLRELVRRLGARWPGADALLVRCAGRSAAFAALLAGWPPDEPPPPAGPLVTRMRSLAAAGGDPQYAAVRAERTGRAPAPRSAAVPVPEQGRAHGTL